MRAVHVEKYEKSLRYRTYVVVYKTEGNKESCNLTRRYISSVYRKRLEGRTIFSISYKGCKVILTLELPKSK